MTETTEIWIRAILTGVAFLLALRQCLSGPRVKERAKSRVAEAQEPLPATDRASTGLQVLAILAVFTYFGLGDFRPDGSFVHRWEQFHYTLGSKYFPELGYDGLYLASLQAQRESDPHRPRPGVVRDLRDNHLVGSHTTWEQAAETATRFSPERWQQFNRDHHVLIQGMDAATLHGVRKDHGFNATPTWTFVARTVVRWVPINEWTLNLFGSLDLLMLGTAAALVWRSFGARAGCWFLITLGLGYPWRFVWVGGSLLRQLWFLSLVASVCALQSRRFTAGGALLALSAMLRIFPAAFFLGPLVLALRHRREERNLRWFKQLALGAAIVVMLSLAAGSVTGRGTQAWNDFATNLDKHRSTWLTNNMGLTVPLLFDVWIQRPNYLTPDPLEPGAGWKQALDTTLLERRTAILVFALALLFLGSGAAWNSKPDQTPLVGPISAFALASVTSYYWIMLLVMLLRPNPSWPLPTLLACNLAACILHLRGVDLFELYGLGSWVLLGLFVVWGLQVALSRSPEVEESQEMEEPV